MRLLLVKGEIKMTSLLPSLWGNSEKPDAPYQSLHREIDKVFQDFSRNFGLPHMSQSPNQNGLSFSPNMDVVESEKALEITTELPGVTEKDVEITIVDNVLTIRGEKNAEKKEEKDDYHMVERTYGSFRRSLRLPFEISADKIDASFKDGILKVILPKPPEVEAKTQKVAIKSTNT
jgi:HSP20 family protein